MDVPTVSPLLPPPPAAAPAAGGDKAPAATADFGSFLKLLTSQLRNQDPLQPLDSTQFIAQLASFSTVEQLVQANERLDNLAARAKAQLGARYAGWIGRQASATDGHFRASGGPEVFHVPAVDGAQRIEAVVMSGEHEIGRFAVAPDAAGNAIWNGAAASGIAPGTELRIELVYHGPESVIERRPAAVFRTITGLRGGNEGPVFELEDGETLTPDEIAELRLAG